MKRLAALSALVLLLSAPSPAPGAQAAGNAIRGKVRLESGAPVAAAIVVLSTGVGTPVNQTVTNNEGDFYFGGLAGTSYNVQVEQPSFQMATEHVDFGRQGSNDQSGETVAVFLTLVPVPARRTTASGVVFTQNVPPAARAAYDRGVQLAKDNKGADAVAAFREATAAFPTYFDAHFALGRELYRMDRLNDAVGELELARQANPKDDRVFGLFGIVLSKLGKPTIAAAAFGEAERMKPDDAQYPLLRATALVDATGALDPSAADAAAMRTQFLDAAERELAQADKVSHSSLPGVHVQRARVFERRGDRKRAADELEAYLKQTPNAPNAATIRETIAKLRAPQ